MHMSVLVLMFKSILLGTRKPRPVTLGLTVTKPESSIPTPTLKTIKETNT